MSSTSDLIVKAVLGDETRRFRIAAGAVSFAELQRTLSEMFAEHVPFKTAYLDADGDLVTFSSENELRDALAQRESDAVPFKILIITTAATNNKTVGDDNAVKTNLPTKVPNVWLELPIWVRYRVMAFNRLVGDVNDAAVFDKLPAHAQERVHARFVAKKDKQDKKFAARMQHLHAPSIVPLPVDQQQQDPVVELKDEELWASMPVWLQQRVVHKFVPHLSPQASDFSSFVALPEHAKISVRNRAAKIVNKRNKYERKYGGAPQQPPVALTNGPHPPSSPPPSETVAAAAAAASSSAAPMSDEALWDSLPPWVQLKVAARAAHSGSVPANPRDFATFQMLPAHVQAKLRAKASRGKFHKKCW